MKLLRVVLSDLHLGTGVRPGEPNAFEDFRHDEDFESLLLHYDGLVGDGELELVLNGDIFDLLKVKIGGVWPTEITDGVACEKPGSASTVTPVVRSLREFMSKERRRIVFIPGNHDLDMWLPGPQQLFRRYVAPSAPPDRIHFVTQSDTYYLPDGIQIRHGHQLERIHRVDYRRMLRRKRDGSEVLELPWGTLWILEVMNPAKELRSFVDRVQPLGRFLLGAVLFDTRFLFRFLWRSSAYFLRWRVFHLAVWRERLARLPQLPEMVREDILSLGGFDAAALRELRRLRGVRTLILGHSHGPRFLHTHDGKLIVNTGTWMKMINLDVQHLGQDSGLTYCTIEYGRGEDGEDLTDGKPRVQLKRWYGRARPFEVIPYAD